MDNSTDHSCVLLKKKEEMKPEYYHEILTAKGFLTEHDVYNLNGLDIAVTYYKPGPTPGNPKGAMVSLMLGQDQEVVMAEITSLITNVREFYLGSPGIKLVSETNDYYKHSLDLFEYCLGLQTTEGLLAHKIKISQCHLKNLEWVQSTLAPVLTKADYTLYDGSFLRLMEYGERDESSDLYLTFRHYNGGDFDVYTDCITGEIRFGRGEFLGKTEKEIWETLKEEYWEKDPIDTLRYSYLYSADQADTKETFKEVLRVIKAIREQDWDAQFNEAIIPESQKFYLEKFKNKEKLFSI